MLKYKIFNIYGSQERHNLEIVKLKLDTENLNEQEALEHGWLYNEGDWYHCRSVRLRVSDYHSSSLPDSFQLNYSSTVTPELKQIYKEYIYIRGFSDIWDIFHDDDRQEFLILTDEGKPVAFTKFMKYNGGLESQFNCWNYHKPKLSLGKRMIDYEVDYARTLGLVHLYIGEGCEAGCIYKSDLKGFEWWTGSEWSTDKQRYKELCIRDANIKTLYDLSTIFTEETC